MMNQRDPGSRTRGGNYAVQSPPTCEAAKEVQAAAFDAEGSAFLLVDPGSGPGDDASTPCDWQAVVGQLTARDIHRPASAIPPLRRGASIQPKAAAAWAAACLATAGGAAAPHEAGAGPSGAATPGPCHLQPDDTQTIHVSPAELCEEFDITLAEAGVLIALMEGELPKRYASRRGLSISTVRSQIASLMWKMDCQRQVDLVRKGLYFALRAATA